MATGLGAGAKFFNQGAGLGAARPAPAKPVAKPAPAPAASRPFGGAGDGSRNAWNNPPPPATKPPPVAGKPVAPPPVSGHPAGPPAPTGSQPMPSTPSGQGPVQAIPRSTDYYVAPPANYAPVGSGAFIPPPMQTTHSTDPMQGDVYSWNFPTVAATPTPVGTPSDGSGAGAGSGSGKPVGDDGRSDNGLPTGGMGPRGDRTPGRLTPAQYKAQNPDLPTGGARFQQWTQGGLGGQGGLGAGGAGAGQPMMQQQGLGQSGLRLPQGQDDTVDQIFHPQLGLRSDTGRAEGGPAEPEGPSDASMATATYKKSQGQFFHSGLVHSAVAGRTDRHPINVAAGAYVVPADIVSGVGEGNTLAGAQVLDAMRHQGPHGTTPLKSKGGGRGIPAPPAGSKFAEGGAADKNPTMIPLPPMPGAPTTPGSASVTQPMMSIDVGMKRGGRKHQPEAGDEEVPIIVAGGEFIYHPNDVKTFGGGDVHKGHDRLDQFVENVRKKLIETTKKLPGPKK